MTEIPKPLKGTLCKEHKVPLTRWDARFQIWRCPDRTCASFIRPIFVSSQ